MCVRVRERERKSVWERQICYHELKCKSCCRVWSIAGVPTSKNKTTHFSLTFNVAIMSKNWKIVERKWEKKLFMITCWKPLLPVLSRNKIFVLVEEPRNMLNIDIECWSQFHQPYGAKCKCTRSHSLVFKFTNKHTPNFTSPLTRKYASL